MDSAPVSPKSRPVHPSSEKSRHVLNVASILNPETRAAGFRHSSREIQLPQQAWRPPRGSESPASVASTASGVSYSSTNQPASEPANPDVGIVSRSQVRGGSEDNLSVRRYPFVGSPESHHSQISNSSSRSISLAQRPVILPHYSNSQLPNFQSANPSWHTHSKLPSLTNRLGFAAFVSSPDFLPQSEGGEGHHHIAHHGGPPSLGYPGSSRNASLSPIVPPQYTGHHQIPSSPSHSVTGGRYSHHHQQYHSASSPSQQPKHQAGSGEEVFEIEVDFKHASKDANARRKRNAEASARFRERGRNKVADLELLLADKTAELRSAHQLLEWFAHEREKLSGIISSLPGGSHYLPLPAIPPLEQRPAAASSRAGSSVPPSSVGNAATGPGMNKYPPATPPPRSHHPDSAAGPSLSYAHFATSPDGANRPSKRPRRATSLNPDGG